VIIDCPPVSAGADVSLIGRVADAVMVVVNLGSVDRDALRDSLTRLEVAGLSPAGVVLNRDRDAENDGYYYAAGR